MTPGFFLAHILAMHLSVPEPITFILRDLWPSERCAQIVRHGEEGFPKAWTLEYDTVCWNKYPALRARVIAHEACHAAYDYQAPAWDSLTYADRDARHGRINACVNKLLRDCVMTRFGVVIDMKARPDQERDLRIRSERQELIERGMR